MSDAGTGIEWIAELQAEVERLRRTNSRLRKAVTWLAGALHDESPAHVEVIGTREECAVWECQRARAVLDETEDKA